MTFTRWQNDPIETPAPEKRERRWYHGLLVPWMSERQPPECIPCGRAKIFEWLGMNWIGYPKPLRKRGLNYAGCGCIERLKKLYINFIRHYLFMQQQQQKAS
jgi:hypothetical protein